MTPNEIWMLWNEPTPEQKAESLKADLAPCFVRAIDGEDCYMAFFSELEAVREAVRQNELYDLNCKAVRVK